METELINQIDKQIDIHTRFMDSMEQIRWRFTSAFGITALAGLVFVNGKLSADEDLRVFVLAAYLIVAAVSTAGLITQVRIIGLFWSQWSKIRTLQLEKLSLLEAQGIVIREQIKSAWSLPHIVPPKNKCGLYSVLCSNCTKLKSIDIYFPFNAFLKFWMRFLFSSVFTGGLSIF